MAKEYLDKLTELLKRATARRFTFVKFECKHFFSGAAVYADGRICMSYTPAGFAIKLPENHRDKPLQKKKALSAFVISLKRQSKKIMWSCQTQC